MRGISRGWVVGVMGPWDRDRGENFVVGCNGGCWGVRVGDGIRFLLFYSGLALTCLWRGVLRALLGGVGCGGVGWGGVGCGVVWWAGNAGWALSWALFCFFP